MLQRIGLIGDVHAQYEALKEAVRFLDTARVETILCTGDIVDGPSQSADDTQHCIALLQCRGIITIRGNHDRWLVSNQMRTLSDAAMRDDIDNEALEYLSALPPILTLETCAGNLLLCHGMGTNDMQMLKPDDDYYSLQWKPELHELIEDLTYSFVIAGHTHTRMVRHFRRPHGVLIAINSGTLLPHLSPCISIVDFRQMQAEFFNLKDGVITAAQTYTL